jgi:hypothetical protein
MGEKFFVKSIEKVKINSNIPEDLSIKQIVEYHLGNNEPLIKNIYIYIIFHRLKFYLLLLKQMLQKSLKLN